MAEIEKGFKDTVEYWKGLILSVHGEMYEILGALNITDGIDPSEFDIDDLANLIRVVRRSIESTQDKVDKLRESLHMTKLIDEVETKDTVKNS